MGEATRTIKFRAWLPKGYFADKDMCRMDSRLCVSYDGKLMELEGGWDYQGDSDLAILMQFTGLQDKNGVDIYEGDIIASWWFDGNPAGDAALYEVCWMDRDEQAFAEVGTSSNYPLDAPAVGLGFRLLRGPFDHKDMKLCYFADRFEVIGDIYQNPDLLTGAKS